MDEAVIRWIEKEGADALLNTGVSVPIKGFRIPFRKKPIVLRFTMKRPCMAGQLLIAKTYLAMGVTSAEMKKFSKEDEMKFYVEHTKNISRIIAYTICRGYISRHLLIGALSWFIRNFMEHRYVMASFRTFIRLMGTKHFMNIIRSAERSNPMKLRLSQRKKGS
ncbi:MAG: hypothetical protein Q4D41_00285 [Prevotellaceae bacterium]|nr:hypothetical protein [Prevotellaceae bacterium]